MTSNTAAKWTLYWGSSGGVALAMGISSDGVASGSFTVPETASGPYTVVLKDGNSGSNSLAAFTVIPCIMVDPTTATPGTSIKAEGHGFYSNEQGIFLTLDETKINTYGFTSDSNGRWSTSFTLPEFAGGTGHLIKAFGSSTLIASVSPVAFTVTPMMTVTPLAGAVGSLVSVSGKGFAANETGVTVTWDGAAVAGTSASINGIWATTFLVPRSTRGPHVLDAYGITTPATSIPDLSFSATSGI
ncbi:MAG: IPT/TIG domain-containing protein, partial [Dehalococcoidales bacterium]|nr:IPT/TIG domain-containing protein [Dehalococcoidales bacterium]